jgi:hypothetical protein
MYKKKSKNIPLADFFGDNSHLINVYNTPGRIFAVCDDGKIHQVVRGVTMTPEPSNHVTVFSKFVSISIFEFEEKILVCYDKKCAEKCIKCTQYR